LVLSISACGSSGGTADSGNQNGSGTAAFTPPAPLDGYARFNAMKVTDIKPGDDITKCQYIMAPVDHDMDVLDIRGAQSKYGHHAVMFSYTPAADQVVGAELPCMMGSTEFTSSDPLAGASAGGGTLGGTFLGAVSTAGGSRAVALPEGVAFRLKQGEGIMLNLHYINTGTEPAVGEAYIDVKLAEVDPNRMIAALFLNMNMSFSLPPGMQTDSSADCVAGSDVNIIMMSNHMHEWGTHATTQVTRADGASVEVLRDDPIWGDDMVNNPPFSTWNADDPFVLHTGDTIRTSCSWNNDTSETLGFPREMCISAGFALASSDVPKAPVCFNGTWVGTGL
jgi:hypothetical protein